MTILRIACYERVSTEEQALRGFSIEAQIDNLADYCENNKMKIVSHYTDEGVSGGKPAFKRPAMSRLLEDVKAGKIDMIIFTKLDRWFRNVKEYFKVQEVLDHHGVEWKAIHEDYDTTTANGRMAITIFLAIAQNEREKTSERIKVVLEHKRKNGEACFGGPTNPMGYRKYRDENGVLRLEKDPEYREIIEAFWGVVVHDLNIKKAIRHVGHVYGIYRDEKAWYRIARSDLYCGEYKGNADFCEPYVSKEDWLRVQEHTKGTRAPAGNRVYLFTGLIRCPHCGSMLCGTWDHKTYLGVQKEYRHYRCRHKGTHRCDYRRSLSELKMEKYLLTNLDRLLADEIARVEIEREKPKPAPKYNIKALKEQLRRLEVVYMAGNKPDAEYLAEQKEIKALIQKAENDAPPPEQDVEPLKELLEQDIKAVYNALEPAGKKRFWRGLVKEIVLEDNQVKEVKFF